MSEKKSVTIDSNSLLGGGGNASKRKSVRRGNNSGGGERKIRPSSIVQPSTLKRTLLERIKQHQRTRERSREETVDTKPRAEAMNGGGSTDSSTTDNFSQSIDFLRKLAIKRRQTTQRHRSSAASGASGASAANATPESQILHKVAETLHNGEIVTNTGLLGLPVVPMVVPAQPSSVPNISVGPMSMPMPMPMPFMPELPMPPMTTSSILPETLPPPKLTELADMYNNTIAAAAAASPHSVAESTSETTTNTAEPSLHIPQKPEDYLPSIFIKEEPPHGCLKNGKKPTFREWATKMLGGGVPPPNDGSASGGVMSGGSGGASGGASGGVMSGGSGGEEISTTSTDIKTHGASSGIDPSQIAGMRVKIRKTHKKRYRIGKHDNVVGVLLKNKETQRHIQSQHIKLKQKQIGEIRKYLYDHHLLKIGSNAPPDVLRRMYEDAILTGDVKNTNDGIMLHNFISGGGE